MTDRTMYAIAAAGPRTLAALLQIHGAGPRLVERYGAAILRLVAAPPEP